MVIINIHYFAVLLVCNFQTWFLLISAKISESPNRSICKWYKPKIATKLFPNKLSGLSAYITFSCYLCLIYVLRKFLMMSENLWKLRFIVSKYLKRTIKTPWLLLTISNIINLVTWLAHVFLINNCFCWHQQKTVLCNLRGT